MQRRVVSFAAIAAALFLGSAVFAQRAGRLFSAPAVFHGGAAQVDKALGRPRAVTAVSPMDRPGEYREYQRQGAKVSVRFKRGKAVAFVVRLGCARRECGKGSGAGGN